MEHGDSHTLLLGGIFSLVAVLGLGHLVVTGQESETISREAALLHGGVGILFLSSYYSLTVSDLLDSVFSTRPVQLLALLFGLGLTYLGARLAIPLFTGTLSTAESMALVYVVFLFGGGGLSIVVGVAWNYLPGR
ncbi:hypothetical protein [Haloarchaeobius sp. DFWS5]|uniref:hypothetical protein n=1 Tax=Haloarchaeobius sp. DFWS5 TaxID=3446114 RepID=UPI003EB7F8C3